MKGWNPFCGQTSAYLLGGTMLNIIIMSTSFFACVVCLHIKRISGCIAVQCRHSELNEFNPVNYTSIRQSVGLASCHPAISFCFFFLACNKVMKALFILGENNFWEMYFGKLFWKESEFVLEFRRIVEWK